MEVPTSEALAYLLDTCVSHNSKLSCVPLIDRIVSKASLWSKLYIRIGCQCQQGRVIRPCKQKPSVLLSGLLYNTVPLCRVPDLKKDIYRLEAVQCHFTKKFAVLRNIWDRLDYLNLDSSDLLMCFKILSGKVDVKCLGFFYKSYGRCYNVTRGNDTRSFLFNHVVNVWNWLPSDVLMTCSIMVLLNAKFKISNFKLWNFCYLPYVNSMFNFIVLLFICMCVCCDSIWVWSLFYIRWIRALESRETRCVLNTLYLILSVLMFSQTDLIWLIWSWNVHNEHFDVVISRKTNMEKQHSEQCVSDLDWPMALCRPTLILWSLGEGTLRYNPS